MKTVFNNRMCAHVWAQQTQPRGRGSSMFFEGPTIYSFGTHFPIATFRTPRVVMFNSAGYSISTSRHQSYTRSAVPPGVDVFKVPAALFNAPPAKVLAELVNEHTFALEKAARARSNTEWQLESAERAAATARTWAQLFKLKAPKLAEFDRPAIMARIAEQTKKHAEQRKRAAAKLEKQRAETIAKFRAGENVYVSGLSFALLRVNGDTVETSQGATVPADDARRAIRFVERVKQSGRDWHRNGEQCPVGQFQIDQITPSGNIKAGCHQIEWSEIETLGRALA